MPSPAETSPFAIIKLAVTGVFVIKGGKIAVWREHFDLGTIVRQWPALAAMAA